MYTCAVFNQLLKQAASSLHCHHHRRRRGGGAARARSPIIEKRPYIYHFLPSFAPPIFWFVRPIFLTILRQWPSPELVGLRGPSFHILLLLANCRLGLVCPNKK